MFIGRDKELNLLNDLYLTDRFELLNLYGPHLIGKTSLIYNFVKNKECIILSCLEDSRSNLESLNKTISERVGFNVAFYTFRDAFDFIFNESLNKKIILVLDNFHNVNIFCPKIKSAIEYIIEVYGHKCKLKLITINTSINNYVNININSINKTNYELKPLTLDESRLFFPKYSFEEQNACFKILGGNPRYLRQFVDNLTITDNIMNTFYNQPANMFNLPISLLDLQVRNSDEYYKILYAIAVGNDNLTNISNYINGKSSTISKYIKKLINDDVVEEAISSEDNYTYKINDNALKFWFTFVYERTMWVKYDKKDLLLNYLNQNLPKYLEIIN